MCAIMTIERRCVFALKVCSHIAETIRAAIMKNESINYNTKFTESSLSPVAKFLVRKYYVYD